MHHRLEFSLKNEKNEQIVVSAKKGQKKLIKRNNKAYEKFSEHIGFIPTVIISPADRDLIVEGSDTRRKFMDGVISQSDNEYLDNLLKYNKTLAQRNSLLKYFAANRVFDKDTLEIYNEQLARRTVAKYREQLDIPVARLRKEI